MALPSPQELKKKLGLEPQSLKIPSPADLRISSTTPSTTKAPVSTTKAPMVFAPAPVRKAKAPSPEDLRKKATTTPETTIFTKDNFKDFLSFTGKAAGSIKDAVVEGVKGGADNIKDTITGDLKVSPQDVVEGTKQVGGFALDIAKEIGAGVFRIGESIKKPVGETLGIKEPQVEETIPEQLFDRKIRTYQQIYDEDVKPFLKEKGANEGEIAAGLPLFLAGGFIFDSPVGAPSKTVSKKILSELVKSETDDAVEAVFKREAPNLVNDKDLISQIAKTSDPEEIQQLVRDAITRTADKVPTKVADDLAETAARASDGEVSNTVIHLPSKNVYAKVNKEVADVLKDEVNNVRFSADDVVHLSQLERVAGKVDEVPLADLLKLSDNARASVKGAIKGSKLVDDTAIGAKFAGENTAEVAAKASDDFILPKEISVFEEAKAVGLKRIAPDRVPHQKLTPQEGIEALIEKVSQQANKRSTGFSDAAARLEKIQAKYGDRLPVRSKANLAKYPDLADDFRIWEGFKRYSMNGSISDALDRMRRFGKAPEITPEQIAKIRESATKDYIEQVRKDISKGYRFPQAVLDFDPSFRKAVDARARYEKGLNTSFSADDSRIVFDDTGKISAGMKRQDGKELLESQKEEIINGVVDTQKALGIDLNQLAKDERWVYVHLNGKNPFLRNNAAGLYRKDPKNNSVSISLGGTESFDAVVNGEKVRKKLNTTVAHELGHALDFKTGNKLFDSQTVYDLARTFKPVEFGFRGNAYWRSAVEVKARAVEQYVAIKEGHTSYFTREGYWDKETFEAKIVPAVEGAIDTHFAEYKKAVADLPSRIEPKKVLPDSKKGTAPASKVDDERTALTSPERVAEEAVKTQRRISGTEPDGVKTAAKLGQAKEIPKTPAKASRYAVKNDPPLEIPDETRLGFLQRKIQDKFNRLGLVQKKLGVPLSDDINAYLQQEMFHGRAAERLDRFEDSIISSKGRGEKALLERMAKDEISVDEMGEFLHAKHAPARNARVAEINPDIPDGGSGLTNKQAAAIIEKYKKAGKLDAMEAYAKEVYEKITKARMEILEKEHLLKPEAVEKISGTFKDDTYVPLKLPVEPEFRMRGGGGFDVRGKDVKRLKGSTEKNRVNPLVQAIVDYEDAVIKAEKNKVARSFKKLIDQNPNVVNSQGKKLWEVEAQQYAPQYNKFGEVEFVKPVGYKLADNVMEVRDQGKIFHITINDKPLASAMKNLGTERGIAFFHQINNYLRSVITFYNPEFMITNFERDIQTALINTGGEQGGKAAARVAKDVPAALRGIWRETRNIAQKNPKEGAMDWAKEYAEMKETGGRVGWFDYKTVAEKQKDIQKRIDTATGNRGLDKAARTWDGIAEFVSDTNEAVESAVRLSAYVNAKKAGLSKEQAAALAKNLTVNFNKKGEWGSAVNSLYLFANAGVQGTTRVFKALKHKRTRRIVAGISAFAYGVEYMNRQVNAEAYDKISDSEKNTNLIFMLPAGATPPSIDASVGSVETVPNTNEKYIKIKLPYGYNIFKVLGDVAYDVSLNGEHWGEALKRLVFAMDESFNPLSSGSAAQLVAPTIADPLVQMYENKNYFGAPIKPVADPYAPKGKQSDMYFSTVREPTKLFTDWLNNVSGGNEVEAGVLDFSPENVDHIIDFLGGGVGKFLANTVETGVKLAQGEVPEAENTPFVRKFIGDVYDDVERNLFYDLVNKGETRLLNEKELADLKKYGKEALDEGQLDNKKAKTAITNFLKSQNRIHAGRVFEKIKNAETPEQRKEIFNAYIEKNALEKRKDAVMTELKDVIEEYKAKKAGDVEGRGFVGTLIAGGQGLLVDPENVLKAMLTEEKLGKVEGNLVELQRFYGLDYRDEGGSQDKKRELMQEQGISWSKAKDYKLEHIVPVKAGGSTADSNLAVLSTAEHDSYTPIDVAVAAAVQAKKMTRKEAESLMRRLKVEKSITPEEAYEEVRATAQ